MSAPHSGGFNTTELIEHSMGDPNREPQVSDEEILSVFARSGDRNLLVTDVADELPIHHTVLNDRLDDLYERGLLTSEERSRGTVWTLASEVEDDLLISESEVETDVEAQATAATGSETTPRQEENPTESLQAPAEEPRGPEITDEPTIEEIETFDPPGSSTDRERNREALRAAYLYLQKRSSAKRDDFETDVFPEYPATYEDPDDWWQEVISPGLEAVSDVETQDDEWRFVGDRPEQ
ncbi:hypothetical protein [Halocatena salina]|uniref:Uncharacterized protein n=1 Tax=Halocatena salina TaxID=2934340 RepID=A0A8U0A9Z8_9EURY|nr:hypothetical protein [Halocatena salina]UPM44657.1 hypothetical protein MW046_16595 [Halocatena salina]